MQEAKEDAEIDAEIALEMAMESQRRLSTASNNSSGEGTYVGPCPHSPGQVGRKSTSSTREEKNLFFLSFNQKPQFKPVSKVDLAAFTAGNDGTSLVKGHDCVTMLAKKNEKHK